MKKVRIIGLMLLALLALGAFAASMASAEEGLLPQQGEKAASGESTGTATLETPSGLGITCTKLSILSILFLKASDIHATANLHFSGCKALGLFAATSLDDLKEPGVILVPKALLLICLVTSATLVFGVLILPEAPVHIEIPAVGELVVVEGAAIGTLSPNEGKEAKVSLVGSKGKQTTATGCEIAGKKLTYSLTAEQNENGKKEASSENVPATIKFAETVKLMDT
jgi:hypothetical protein